MIVTQIQAIVNQLTEAPGFLYGTADELNLQLDSQKTFPVVCMYALPPIESSFTLSNAISNKFNLQIKFLYKSTFDQNTAQNEAIADQALTMANEFMVTLANYRDQIIGGRYFKVHQKDRAQVSIMYNDFDINLTGVKLTMNLNTMYNANVPVIPWP
ncbi:MAG TPA: hypothetical protein VGN20_20490 [Mucilaginibacter sp.]|jgi:hypothetical protein